MAPCQRVGPVLVATRLPRRLIGQRGQRRDGSDWVLAGRRRVIDGSIDQLFQSLDGIGDNQLARDVGVRACLFVPKGINDDAPMVRSLHGVGLAFILGVLAHQLEKDLDGPVEQLFPLGGDQYVDSGFLTRVSLDRSQDAAACQVAKPLLPGRVELPGDQGDDCAALRIFCL